PGTGRLTIPLAAPSRDAAATAVAIDDAGRIVVAGYADEGLGAVTDYEFAVVRLTPEGKLDGSFGTGGIKLLSIPVPGGLLTSNDKASAVAIDPTDKSIVVAGATNSGAIATPKFAVVRLSPTDGTPVGGFGTNGKQTVGFGSILSSAAATGVGVEPDGKVVLGGYTSTATGKLT